MKTKITDIYVLGAGSSVEVGMPVGSRLKSLVAESLDIDYSSGKGNHTIRSVLQTMVNEDNNPNQLAERIGAACTRITTAIKLAKSIDQFMYENRSNKEIQLCAKLAIANAIAEEEKKSHLKLEQPNLEINKAHVFPIIDRTMQTWFAPFFEIFKYNCEFEELPERLEKILFINFNYDRCLEHYLMCALMAYYDKEQREVAPILKELNIYHPYGQIGILPWQDGSQMTHAFGAPINRKILQELSSQIQTFGEEIKNPPLKKIQSAIANVQKMIFLGFAFHPLNMDLLFNGVNNKVFKKIIASTHGLTKDDAEEITDDFKKRLSGANISKDSLYDNKFLIEVDPSAPITCGRVFERFNDRHFYIT